MATDAEQLGAVVTLATERGKPLPSSATDDLYMYIYRSKRCGYINVYIYMHKYSVFTVQKQRINCYTTVMLHCLRGMEASNDSHVHVCTLYINNSDHSLLNSLFCFTWSMVQTHRCHCHSFHVGHSSGAAEQTYVCRERRLETWLALLALQTLYQCLRHTQ